MSAKEDTVEVTVKLPKAIVDFLKDMDVDVEGYIVHNVIGVIEADLEADGFCNPKRVVEKHNLVPIFEKHGLSISSYIDPREI